MAGHSKWANIKHRKSAVDAKRGKIFTKLIREITVAAKMGGSDLDSNPRLRLAVDKARGQSMPKDNIERAIKKGAGELDGESYEEISYEGYGPGGVAILVECTTDNKNRTVSEIRNIFSKRGGNLGENGSVAWMFKKQGVIRVDDSKITEEELFEKAIEAGAEDLTHEDSLFIVTTAFEDLHTVLKALQEAGIEVGESAVEMVPENSINVTDKDQGEKLLTLLENLEDNDDVQNVWSNFEMDDALMEEIGQ